MKKLSKVLFLKYTIGLTLLAPLFLTAAEAEHLARQQVTDTAEHYVIEQLRNDQNTNLKVETMELDERIAVPVCPSPLVASASEEALRQASVTVRVSCEDTNWYLYLVVKATQMQHVAVMKSTVSPGTILTRNNVELMEMNEKQIRRTTFPDVESVLGARIKRRLRPGQPITPNQLCFVCKGDTVIIQADLSGLSIKATGVAEEDGNIGDTIRVKNISSNKIIGAKVTDTNQVEVHI